MAYRAWIQFVFVIMLAACASENRDSRSSASADRAPDSPTVDPNALANSYEDYRAGRGRNYLMAGDTIRLHDWNDSLLIVVRRSHADRYQLITNGPILGNPLPQSKGRFFWAPPNTMAEILVLEDPGPYMKVRIIEGPFRDRTGWIAAGRWIWRQR
jgi:hypothetical protein